MSKISLAPDASGTGIFTIASPGTSTNRTLTLPDDTGTIVTNSGNQAGSFTTLNTSGQVVFNDAGADVDFRVEGDTNANLLFVDASADKVGIGTSSPATKLQVGSTGESVSGSGSAGYLSIRKPIDTTSDPFGTNMIDFYPYYPGFESSNPAASIYSGVEASLNTNYGYLAFSTSRNSATTERLRITSDGNVLVGKTSVTLSSVGGVLTSTGRGYFTTSADNPLFINRLSNDGTLVDFSQDTVNEGTISVLNNTVSYNPFLGSHSGALADWSRPDIKIGTVMDTIDELLEYKVVVIDVQEEVPAKEAVLDEEGNEVEPAQEATTQTVQKRISYNGNGAVGSSATVEYEGQEYTGTIQHEREEPLSFNKHLKVKINDTAASKAVFGVFVGWNNDSNNDGGVYNDMLVGAVGNYVIRMAAGQEPQIGDLVEADGNGCAVVQDDDIIRTKTIAKVTSTIKQVTYDDGSFLVTCVLYCG